MQDNIRIYYADVSMIASSRLSLLLDALPTADKEKLLTFHLHADRLRGAVGKHLLKKILLDEGYGPDILESVKTNEWSRPFIDDRIDFNISHSGDIVVIAMGRNLRLGIDVEEIKPVDIDDFELFFSAEELLAIKQSPDPLVSFYHLWTKKEAVLKANGKGMYLPIEEVNLIGNAAVCESEDWELSCLQVHPQYACCVAFQGKRDIICEELQLKFDQSQVKWEDVNKVCQLSRTITFVPAAA
jgi:4'-phosphopantetheinyl transferase